MKIAIIGSRNLEMIDLSPYLSENVTELVSGGARGIDTCVRNWALSHGIPLREFLPDYARYGRRAPLVRNDAMVDYADAVVALWDGTSRGTAYTIRQAEKRGVPVTIYTFKKAADSNDKS